MKNFYPISKFNNPKAEENKLKKSKIQKLKSVNEGFIFVYIYGINNQDVKSLIKTLRLPLIVTKEVQYADAILAFGTLVKNNKKLRQISHSKKISIHTLQSSSLLQIAKALRQMVKKTVPITNTSSDLSLIHI